MAETREPRLEYVLRLGDSALVLGQRLSEWCGHAPVLEEELALANTALDLLGQARLLLTRAGQMEGAGRDEDALAFLRDPQAFRNVTLVELPNGDFARTVLRNLLFCAFQEQLWAGLRASSDAELAAIAAKSAKETRYHVEHAADWCVRLGDGTDESHQRMQEALDTLWPYTAELFTADAVDEAAAATGFGPAWASLEAGWQKLVRPVLEEATLAVPAPTAFRSTGKGGVHSEHLGHLLALMQTLPRSHPGARW
ncbi:MAG: 1,2-phenylacetyl-CoA epoxidase subunit PaaC [Betaproteobacteria bacterium]|jgi:ring-1,2-phenylacetyl-CoA epoxidase subunit PaaC|nr:phenylacetate-CoA oxygenase subunit PaaC [Rhodocyclaceae bacterium]MCA3134369.1 phenylacetate-CoA oxygenase subunit PaaC [Rhodocyclaceae bacterium]MCA3141168.1 phenylacetate-CoA oxygenase subunit PaaC [Rhodocyclaceae bacterium]MCA3145067.1 phenylacetate-CoA oxygenase subunit PaaC [Rhodocyclaceae bacterium]MCE2897914.1 phenylacetate-CoA oxygenase subunit PaaC [Betaproteobacteria bacterium]